MPYQNNNRPTINVNTKFFTSYSDNSLMTVSAWNANLSIKFHPLKSISPNGQKIYAQDINETIIVPISPESAHSIRDGIENIILPAIENNEEDKVIFMLGSENIKKCFSILTEKNETGTVDVYVTVSYNISEDFVDNTETVLRHKLSTRRYKRGSEIKEVQTDLLRILDKVKNIDNLSQTIGHGYHLRRPIHISASCLSRKSRPTGRQKPSFSFSPLLFKERPHKTLFFAAPYAQGSAR